jgi:hypothetical protein
MSLLLAKDLKETQMLLNRNKFGILTDLGTNLATVYFDTPHCNYNDIIIPYCIDP